VIGGMSDTRAMRATDGAQILAINRAGQPGVAALGSPELARLLSLPHEHLVATCGGDVVGYLLAFHRDAPYDGEEFLTFRQLFSEPYLYVDQIAVGSKVRNRGIGRRLYEDIGSIALRNQVGLVCCEINIVPPNEASLAFHQKLGFTPVTRLLTRDARQVQLLARKLLG
jgi:predicted GNAT superfamily acetyltransferase